MSRLGEIWWIGHQWFSNECSNDYFFSPLSFILLNIFLCSEGQNWWQRGRVTPGWAFSSCVCWVNKSEGRAVLATGWCLISLCRLENRSAVNPKFLQLGDVEIYVLNSWVFLQPVQKYTFPWRKLTNTTRQTKISWEPTGWPVLMEKCFILCQRYFETEKEEKKRSQFPTK